MKRTHRASRHAVLNAGPGKRFFSPARSGRRGRRGLYTPSRTAGRRARAAAAHPETAETAAPEETGTGNDGGGGDQIMGDKPTLVTLLTVAVSSPPPSSPLPLVSFTELLLPPPSVAAAAVAATATSEVGEKTAEQEVAAAGPETGNERRENREDEGGETRTTGTTAVKRSHDGIPRQLAERLRLCRHMDPEQDYRLPAQDVVTSWIEALRDADRDNYGRCVRHAKIHRSASHLTAYESYLVSITEQYNTASNVTEKASYVQGCIFLSFPVIYNNTQGCGYKYDWSNVVTPKAAYAELFFLLCSTSESSVVLQPLITKGGLCSSMAVYDEETMRQSQAVQIGFLHTQLVMVPFVPHACPHYAVPFTTPGKPGCGGAPSGVAGLEETAPFGRVSITRHGATLLCRVDHLTWISKRVTTYGHKKITRYLAQFRGTMDDDEAALPGEDEAWIASKNVQYEFMGLIFTVNVDSLCVDAEQRQLLGTVATSFCHRVSDKITARNMPRAFSFYLLTSAQRGYDLRFSRNPSLFFSGDALNCPLLNEPNVFSLTVHAPYDIHFGVQPRQTVELDLRYVQITDRCFLVANLPHEDAFYTGLSVWRGGEPLKVTLWTRTRSIVIPQGTPIATLYQITEGDGNVYSYNHHTVFRQMHAAGATTFFLGDMQLPADNFLTSPHP